MKFTGKYRIPDTDVIVRMSGTMTKGVQALLDELLARGEIWLLDERRYYPKDNEGRT